MPADHVHTQQAGGPADAVEDRLGVGAIRADHHVHESQRAAAHRADVRHVGHHRRGARGVRVGGEQVGRDRLAAEQQELAAVWQHGRVVALAHAGEPLQDREVALALQAGGVADSGREVFDVEHDARVG